MSTFFAEYRAAVAAEYLAVMAERPEGVTIAQLVDLLGTTKLTARGHVERLCRDGSIVWSYSKRTPGQIGIAPKLYRVAAPGEVQTPQTMPRAPRPPRVRELTKAEALALMPPYDPFRRSTPKTTPRLPSIPAPVDSEQVEIDEMNDTLAFLLDEPPHE